jgi:hypothetical protein
VSAATWPEAPRCVAVAAQKGASAEAKHAGSSMRTEVSALPTEAEDVVQVVVAVALAV